MAEETVRYSKQGGIARITLDRPAALNALDLPTLTRLSDVATEASRDDSVRVVLLTGAGRGFCAGGDVKAMTRGTSGDRSPLQLALDGTGALHQAISALYRMPKPVVAAVNGPAAGAGVGLALACDIVWAAQSAHFTASYTGIGLSPDGGTTYFLPRVVGPKLAAELLLTNRRVSSEEALRIGLVSRVLPDEELMPEVEALLAQLEKSARLANARVKRLLRSSPHQGLENQLEDERQGIADSFAGPELAEGLMAFLQQRTPDFRNSR